ncbi:hypothetical protein ODY55_02450 [Aerococcus sp. JJEM-2022c]|nr:hypothetical protein [Aerococcus sp. Group 2]MCY3039121.1 hypothetical protein [Aerococcus sp. Group 2]
MVGKNNLKVKKEKQSNKFYRYSIRRQECEVRGCDQPDLYGNRL